MSGRRRGASAVLIAVAVLCSGCLAIPSGGPVQEVEAAQEDSTTAVYQPAPPAPGADPQEIVSGFLDAQLAYPPSTGVAEQFLTPEAADRWNPSTGTLVYAEPDVGPSLSDARSGQRVDLEVERVLSLDAAGRVVETGGSATRSFRLARVGQEWRLSSVPDGLLVSRKFHDDYYRAFDVFFFDQAAERLAPSVVHHPIGEQLATSLVTSLARGPRDESAQLRTFLPGLSDVRPSVPLTADGIAEVELGSAVAELEVVEQGKLAAQLVRTLQQVPGITGVRISSGGSPITPDDRSVQPVRSWSQYVPRPGVEGPYALVDGAAVELVGRTAREVPDVWGVDPTASRLAVGSRRVATASAAGDAVAVRSRAGGEVVALGASDVLALSWVTGEELLVVDRPGTVPRVRALRDAALREVGGASLPPGTTSFATSPDGARYALTVGDTVRLGPLVREDGVVARLGPARTIPWDVRATGSVAWVDGSRLAFLTATDLGVQVAEGRIDGTGLEIAGTGGRPVLPDVDANRLVATGDQRWAVDARRRLWYLGSRAVWTRPDLGAVRSLSPGP